MEELFYQIILEAANKRVYTDRPYNIVFNSIINTVNDNKVLMLNKIKTVLSRQNMNINITINKNSISVYAKEDRNLFIPTLMIHDLDQILAKLEEYLIYARDFYDKNYYDSIEYEDKTILTLLWANATEKDFNNPIAFIEKRTQFLKDTTFDSYLNDKIIGTSSILKSNIKIIVQKEPIYEETPYSFHVEMINEENSNERFIFPKLRFGLDNGKCTIMAIQNKNNGINNNPFFKRIKRCLNKVNQNFEKEENIDNIESPENLTGIVPSFCVITTIFLSILQKHEIKEIEVAPFLPIRWNAKELKYLKVKEMKKNKNIESKKIETEYIASTEDHYNIQRNLSDKLIRNFRRLAYHFNNIQITLYPYEMDEFLHLELTDEYFCNNDLLNELYQLSFKEQKRK